MAIADLRIFPLIGMPDVAAGDDLAALLMAALHSRELIPERRDVLVVAQKIVSKAEGRIVRLSEVTPSARACDLAVVTGKDARLVELVLGESGEVIRAAPGVLVVRHKLGLVMANAGIDRSNIGGVEDAVLLLPADPDRSAERLREAMLDAAGDAPAIIISDSFGRPWRMGTINIAIGVAGLPALVDRRGERDRYDRVLEATEIALADAIACAAGLAMGEAAEGIPAAVIRGLDWNAPERPAAELIRPLSQDLFR